MAKLSRFYFPGEVPHRFTIIRVAAQSKKGISAYLCRCICGTERLIPAYRIGKTQSCGCLQREISRQVTAQRNLKHGHHIGGPSKTYRSWQNMLTRCENPKYIQYADYGGRGIKVCKRWHKFKNFLADMGERPAGRSLDRYDNDKNYTPDNCRWATPKQQANNRRDRRRPSVTVTN
jgi:hypothetical protein